MDNLYQLPDGWEYVKLANVVGKEKTAMKRGPFGSALKKAFFVPDGYKVYEQKHAIRNDFSLGEYYIDEEKFNELKGFEVKGGDIIISCSGTIGKIAVAPLGIKQGIINQALLKITLDNNIVETDFFVKFWTDYVNKGMSEGSTKGAAIKNLASVKVLKDLDIPLPPLEEQKRILSKLDDTFSKLDRAIQLHQENIDEANAYMSSVLNEVFSELEEKYEVKKVVDSLDYILTGTTPPKKEPKYYDDPTIEWYSPSDFGKTKILADSKNMINEVSIVDKKAKMYEEDTLLLVAIGATVGKVGVLKAKASSNQQITALKFNSQTDVDFAYYWFSFIKGTIVKTASSATMPIINQTAIKALKFILVPLEEQKKMVKYFDSVSSKMDKIKSLQKAKLQELKALKASILDSAFRGEL